MDLLTIEELTEKTGFSRRTIDTRIATLVLSEPDLQNKYVSRAQFRNRQMYALELLPLLLDNTRFRKVRELKEIKPRKLKTPKPIKEVKPKKVKPVLPKKVELIHAEIVSEAETIDELDDHRVFEIVGKIIEEYEMGNRDINECCKVYELKLNRFWYWVNHKAGCRELWEAAKLKHDELLNVVIADAAKKQLLKLIRGYVTETESFTYNQKIAPNGDVIDIPVDKRVYRRMHGPNFNAVLLALTNRDGADWKKQIKPVDQQSAPVVDPLELMSDEELDKYLEEARAKGLIK